MFGNKLLKSPSKEPLSDVPREAYGLQWSGAGSINVYAPQFFSIAGMKASSEGLLSTANFGIVKFVSFLISAMLLLDLSGKKSALCIGITLQLVAMTYMALFLTIGPSIGSAGGHQCSSQKHAATGAISMIYFSGVESPPIPRQRRDIPFAD